MHFGRPVDISQIHHLLEVIGSRHDCADFRVLSILKALYRYADQLDPATTKAMRRAVLGFKYWMDEPGHDDMCYWSENHQVLFHTCEYMAGQLYPNEVFTNDGRLGSQHLATARVRLLRWMKHRFLYGFTEWLSNTYYEENVAAMAMLIDHCEDSAVATRAAIVLDLLLLDMAAHRCDGHFVASAGRAYEGQKKDPARADVNDILVAAFGQGEMGDLNFERVSATFILSERYEVPPVIKAIAASDTTMRMHFSFGLDLDEVAGRIGPPMDVESTGMFFWLMEAFSTVEAIEVSVKTVREWKLWNNHFLRPFRYIAKPWLLWLRVLPLLVRILNPAIQGLALQRANVTTYRTRCYLLSSAQRYHPGHLGGQQHIWTAALPNRINVFAVHPGAPILDPETGGITPSYWVGNGRNPHVAQHEDVLLATYDTRGRRGLLEPKRARLTHLHFPTDRFNEVVEEPTLLCGRSGKSYIAVRSLRTLVCKGPDDFVQHGTVTGYAVLLSDHSRHATFGSFVAWARRSRLVRRGRRMQLDLGHRHYVLTYRGDMRVNGRPMPDEHPRFDTPFVKAEREADCLDIAFDSHTLHLDFANGVRRIDSDGSLDSDLPRVSRPVVSTWTMLGTEAKDEPYHT